MTTYTNMTASELLTSFNTGQGKTNSIPEFASIDNGVVSYNNLTANVSQSWLEAFALMNLHKDLKDASTDRQEKLFKAYNEGRLSLNHSTSDDTAPKSKTALTGHVLTSNEYYDNCIKLAATYEVISALNFDMLNALSSEKSITKQQLIDLIKSMQERIVNDTQQTTFRVMVDKEANFEKVKTELSELATLTFISETKIKAVIKPANLDNVINKFTELNYVQSSVEFDVKSMSMIAVFDNEKV
jgi:hypothetical protein